MRKITNPVLDYSQVPSLLAKQKKLNKYGAIRTKNADGTTSDSKREARWDAAIFMAAKEACVAYEVIRKEKYPLIVNGKKVCYYVCDWAIYAIGNNGTKYHIATADCKGFKTPIYRLKKKMFKAMYGYDIIEDLNEILSLMGVVTRKNMVGVYGMETEEAAREVAERDTLEWLKSQGLQPIPEKSDLPTEEIKNVCHDICGKNLCYTCPLNFSDNHCYYDDIWWVTYADKINAAIAANRVKLAEGNSNESQRKVQP